MSKVECLAGQTVQYANGTNYSFERDKNGKFVATIHDERALACFKDHPAYRILDDLQSSTAMEAVTAPITQPDAKARTKKDAIEEAKTLGVAVTQRMSIAEIDAAIAEHQAKLAAELLANLTPSATEPALDPDGNAPVTDLNPGSTENSGEQSGGVVNSGDSAGGASLVSDPVTDPDADTQPDPDVSDDD